VVIFSVTQSSQLDPKDNVSEVRAAALASLNRNRMALTKIQPSAAALAARLAVLPTKTYTVARIGYRPLQREANQLKNDLMLKSFGIIGPYEGYGSTDGEWREAASNGRIILPPGCAPRRSKRLVTG
jgi:hypothetical protein